MLVIHKKILQEKQKNVNSLTIKRKQLKKLQNTKTTSYTKRIIEDQCMVLQKEIDNIENDVIFNYYTLESDEYIKDYEKILNKPKKIDFFTQKPIENDNEQKEIEIKYREVVQKYYPNFIEQNSKDVGKRCNCNNIEDENAEISICLDCGLQLSNFTKKSSFKDSDRINTIPKYVYDRRTHFKDCIKQFQGKQNSTIAQCVYDDLIKKFEMNRLLVGNKNTPKKKRFSKITKKIVQLFLKETGYSKHYEDVVLIHANLTDTQPPDISHLENKLLADFDKLVDVYDELIKERDINRKSFVNTQYILFQLLNKYDYPVNEHEFNILKTLDRKMFHDEICKELFEKLQWNIKKLY